LDKYNSFDPNENEVQVTANEIAGATLDIDNTGRTFGKTSRNDGSLAADT